MVLDAISSGLQEEILSKLLPWRVCGVCGRVCVFAAFRERVSHAYGQLFKNQL
jgi:hypothetical protein